MYFHLHFWRLESAACLIATTQAHLFLPRLTTFLHSTAAMASPSTADATMGDATTPDGATTPEVAVTTDSSGQGTPPPQNYTEANYRFNHSTPGTTANDRQPSWSNYTSQSTRLPLRHHCTTTLPTLNFSLHLHLKSINYSHNNKQLHFHNLTTHDPSTASQETSGCHTTIPHCSAFHYLKQPMYTTTTQLHFTLQLATTPTTPSSNYRLDNNSS